MRVILPLIFVLSINACASHAPMSETVMFTPKKQNDKLYDTYKQYGMSGNYDAIEKEVLYPERSEREDDGLYSSFGISFFRTFFIGDSLSYPLAMNFSIGKGTGMDFTVNLYKPLYLTAGFSYPIHYEWALGVKLLHTNWVGLSASPVFRNQVISYDEFSDCSCFELDAGPEGFDSYKSVGLKTNLYIFVPGYKGSGQGFLSFRLEAGRIMEPASNYFTFGMRIGGY